MEGGGAVRKTPGLLGFQRLARALLSGGAHAKLKRPPLPPGKPKAAPD